VLLLVPLMPEYKASPSPIYSQYGYGPQHANLAPWSGPKSPHLLRSIKVTNGSMIRNMVIDYSGGTIYAGSTDGNVYAVDLGGRIKWHLTVVSNPDVYKMSYLAMGPDGTVYVGGDQYLYAINPDGSVRWAFPGVFSGVCEGISCVIYKPMLTVGPENLVLSVGLPSQNGYLTLYAINPDGTLKWKFAPNLSFSQGTIRSPGVALDPQRGAIYSILGTSPETNRNTLFALNLDGTQRWNCSIQNAVVFVAVDPASGVVYTLNIEGHLISIDPVTGGVRWSKSLGLGGESYNPAIGPDGTIYIYNCYFYAIKPDGTLKWALYNYPAPLTWSRFYAELYQLPDTYMVDKDGTVYLALSYGSFGSVWALNPDRSHKWEWFDPKGIPTSMVVAGNGTLVVGDSAGYIHILSDSPKSVSQVKNPSEYPQLGYNPQHNGLSPWKGPQTNRTVMSVRVTPKGIGGIAVGPDKTVYITGGDGSLYAVDLGGRIKWVVPKILPNITNYFSDAPNFTVPAVGSDGNIYVVGTDIDRDEILYIIGPDGNIRKEVVVYCTYPSPPPIVSFGPDGTVILTGSGRLFVAPPENLAVLWPEYNIFLFRGAVLPFEGQSFAVDSAGNIYLGSGRVYKLDGGETLTWILYNRTLLTVGPDGTIYVAEGSQLGGEIIGSSYVHAIDPSGTEKWVAGPINCIMPYPSAVGPDGTLYIFSAGAVYAVGPDGKVKWNFTMSPYHISADVVVCPLFYWWGKPAVGADGTLYAEVLSYYYNLTSESAWLGNGSLWAIGPDGKVKWRWDDPHGVPISNIVITDDLIVGDSAGYLYFFRDLSPPEHPKTKISVALAPDYSLWVLLLVAMCVAGFAFASRGKIVLGISFIIGAIAVYYVVLRPFVSLQTLIAQAQQLLSNALAQIPLGPILPAIVAIAGVAVLLKILKK